MSLTADIPTEIQEIDAWLRMQRSQNPGLRSYESKARAAMRHVGMPLPNGHGTPRETPDWQAYRRAHATPSELHQCGVLCAQHGESAADVTQASIDRYWHQAIEIEGRPEASTRASTRRLVAHFNEHPTPAMAGTRLRVPGVKIRPTPPALSPIVIAETAAWERCRIEGRAGCGRVNARTAETERRCLIAVARAATTIAPLNSLAALVCPATLEPALRALEHRLRKDSDPDRRRTMAYDAARVCCLVAESGVLIEFGYRPVGGDEMARLLELRANNSPKGRELSRTLRGKLRPFIDPARLRELLQVPMVAAPPPSEGPLTTKERQTLAVCAMLTLYVEIPEMPVEVASLPLAAFEPVGAVFDVYRSTGRAPGETPIARLNPASAQLLLRYKREVRDQHPHAAAPWLFLGRGGRPVSPPWFRAQVQHLIQTCCHIKVSLLELRMVLAFAILARDPAARDLAACYLGHERRAALEPLVKLVDDWRRSGALKRWDKKEQ